MIAALLIEIAAIALIWHPGVDARDLIALALLIPVVWLMTSGGQRVLKRYEPLADWERQYAHEQARRDRADAIAAPEEESA